MLLDAQARSFDVLCVGDALLSIGRRDASLARPTGGAVTTALALARERLNVALVSVLADDRSGRALLARLGNSGVDVAGVARAAPSAGIVFVRGGARQLVASHEAEQPITIPDGWSSQVLLLSGLSPVVAHAAAFCKAARAGRRAGYRRGGRRRQVAPLAGA